MSRIAALLITLSLAACGMKGPLELPPGPHPEPLLGSGQKATAKNVSTPPPARNP
ncbi:MAG: lipoprotein [Dechloromonas sp.]|nr:lipoprotein [Dechloromonas sp.]